MRWDAPNGRAAAGFGRVVATSVQRHAQPWASRRRAGVLGPSRSASGQRRDHGPDPLIDGAFPRSATRGRGFVRGKALPARPPGAWLRSGKPNRVCWLRSDKPDSGPYAGALALFGESLNGRLASFGESRDLPFGQRVAADRAASTGPDEADLA